MGYYIAPNDASTIEDVVPAIIRRPQGGELHVAGNFNADLANPEGTARAEEISEELETSGLEYISTHFLLRRKYWSRDGRTWKM